MSKHTKGKWCNYGGQIYIEETGRTVCLIPYYDDRNEEADSNARLIAEAPEMYEDDVDLAGYSYTEDDIEDPETCIEMACAFLIFQEKAKALIDRIDKGE